jgi:hypothetical protein
MPQVYVVTDFGCDSGYNAMWIPQTKVFEDKEKAYAYYQSKKDQLGKYHSPKIDVKYVNFETGESAIEAGGPQGAKRPDGVCIRLCEIE